MRTLEQWTRYEHLELLSNPDERRVTRSRPSPLQKIWQWFVSAMARNSEPRIWKVLDSNGNPYWRIHDPASDRMATLASEAEVRIWLEQRYYVD
ncbi:MAG TPA: hypothetical protein ACFE0H_11690 [Elainellaceae cyanobacterium]|jgi:hypothetical protein